MSLTLAEQKKPIYTNKLLKDSPFLRVAGFRPKRIQEPLQLGRHTELAVGARRYRRG